MKPKVRSNAVLKTYFRAGAKYPGLLLGAFIGASGIELANLIAPLFIKHFVDLIATMRPGATPWLLLATPLAFYGVAQFCGWIFQRVRMLSLMGNESKVESDLMNDAFGYLIRHSDSFFASNFTGALTRRVTRYSKAYEQVLDSIVMNFFPAGFFATGAIIVLSLRNPLLGLTLLVGTVIFLIVQFVLTRWRHEYKRLKAEEDSRVTGVLADAVGNHATITLFANAQSESNSFARSVARLQEVTMKSWIADANFYAVQGLLALLIEVSLFFGALYLWQRGLLTIGDFVLIQVYVIGLIERIWLIGSNMRRLYDSFADASEMIEILETPHAIQDSPHAKELEITEGSVTFSHVRFEYHAERSVLKDLDLSIPGGQKVAFVGPSGAGKSTITKLLLRLYDRTGGEIRIDGQDIAEVTQESLRRAIGFVPQEPILFHRSLRDNIRYARPVASDEEVIAAAKKAHAHEFISGFEHGYDTLVGERGVKLSGGERQRVAIARAILKNAPILVLDEATSSLDSESEHFIQEALDVLMEGKTVIVIAHRLSTIMKMDRIVVMEEGRIVSEGTHEKLLAEGGLYHKLWSIQAGGFIGGDEEPSDE